jgi:hypothetical protein
MSSVHHHRPIVLRPLSTQQFRIAMGLAVAALSYADIQQLAPGAFGLTLRSGRPAAFHVMVQGEREGSGAQLVIETTLVNDADCSEALEIASHVMDSLPAWCDVVWATGMGTS